MKKRILTLMLISFVILASGLALSCANNRPIDESRLPDLGEPTAEKQTDDTKTLITEEEAMNIALEKVPGASEKNMVSFGRDYDDGRWTYEGEIRYDGLEYEFEIDAQTGNILEWEIDR